MTAYYNEIDPYAAQWLRNLIAAGHIAPGVVDERDIREVEAYEIAEFTQCHFFAGIGVWSYALRQAGWADNAPVWSTSCPCPPFSQAGKGQTCPDCGSRRNICHPRKTGHFVCLACGCDRHADDRHLWPEFARLVRDGKPPAIVGEQVASADGRIWLGAVSADLETMGYAVAGADLCAAGFDGAHIRQREYFVGLGDSQRTRLERHAGNGGNEDEPGWDGADAHRSIAAAGDVGGMADGNSIGQHSTGSSVATREEYDTQHGSGFIGGTGAPMLGRHAADWLFCRDAKWRPVESGTFPLVDEAPSRMGRLRAYGNALDAETATNFCIAVKGIADDLRSLMQEFDL